MFLLNKEMPRTNNCDSKMLLCEYEGQQLWFKDVFMWIMKANNWIKNVFIWIKMANNSDSMMFFYTNYEGQQQWFQYVLMWITKAKKLIQRCFYVNYEGTGHRHSNPGDLCCSIPWEDTHPREPAQKMTNTERRMQGMKRDKLLNAQEKHWIVPRKVIAKTRRNWRRLLHQYMFYSMSNYGSWLKLK